MKAKPALTVLPLFLCFGLVLTSCAPFVAEASDGFLVNGAGVVSCGKILEHMGREEGSLQIKQWIWGYLSAYNEFHKEQVNFPDDASLIAYVRNYCTNKPLDSLLRATKALLSELPPPRG